MELAARRLGPGGAALEAILSVCMTAALMPSGRVGTWPERPGSAPRGPGCTAPGVEQAFPSGRAAILACLRLAGVRADSVVATPECVSGCVNAAVRRLARPVSLRVAVDGSTRASAAIVYEQWGWPLPEAAQDALRERFAGVPVIVDRVDSADFFFNSRSWGAFEVLSLSKVLGMDAGGLARRREDSGYVRFTAAAGGAGGESATSAHSPLLCSHPAVRELFKQSQGVHPGAIAWLEANCAILALDSERLARCTAARLLLDSELGAGWPAWMMHAIRSGAGPVWAPVLRGSDPQTHARAVASLEVSLGVRAAVRTFNWSGDPLSPRFEPSLAVPIHSGLQASAELVAVLETTPGVR